MGNPFDKFGSDAILQSLAPAVTKMLEPVFAQTRAGILEHIAGKAPASFARKARTIFTLSDDEVNALWAAAIDAAAETLQASKAA